MSMSEVCQKGKHKLVVILRSCIDSGIDAVVRWCEVCGSVIVDEDFDGRTNAGSIMKMKSPKIAKKA